MYENDRAVKGWFIGLLAAIGIGIGPPVWGIPVTAEKQSLYPLKIDVPLKIDGVLDDEAWQQPPLEKDFITYYPGYGEKLSQKSSVRMAYDKIKTCILLSCAVIRIRRKSKHRFPKGTRCMMTIG